MNIAHFIHSFLQSNPMESLKMFDLSNSTVGELNWPSLPTYVSMEKVATVLVDKDHFVYAWDLFYQQLNISNLWKILLVVHIIANFKTFPFIYHLRILNAVRFVLRSQRPKDDVKPEQLFQPLITSSKACLMEIDVYGHKSNSTYFADVDIARAHLVTTLFGKGIHKIRGSTTMNGLSGKGSSKFTMALGAVSCSFRKELRPYETYDMWTRILSWDEKWIYIVTHFVKKGAKITPGEYTLYPRQKSLASTTNNSRQNSVVGMPGNTPRGSVSSARGSVSGASGAQQSGIAASALSKIVFKDGRITISPKVILEAAELLPPRRSESKSENREELIEAQVTANLSNAAPQKATQTVDKLDGSDDESESSRRPSFSEAMREWTWEKIEAERQRGMKMATLLAQQTSLEDEFVDEAALGRHYDGYGVEGVVSTLAQLGGFSKYQLL